MDRILTKDDLFASDTLPDYYKDESEYGRNDDQENTGGRFLSLAMIALQDWALSITKSSAIDSTSTTTLAANKTLVNAEISECMIERLDVDGMMKNSKTTTTKPSLLPVAPSETPIGALVPVAKPAKPSTRSKLAIIDTANNNRSKRTLEKRIKFQDEVFQSTKKGNTCI
jgi:hypothetical protein